MKISPIGIGNFTNLQNNRIPVSGSYCANHLAFRGVQGDTFARMGTQEYLDKNVRVLYSERKVKKEIKRVAKEINKAYGTKEDLVLVCVLKGAAKFHTELARHLKMPVTMEYIRASSYKGKTKSSGYVQLGDTKMNVEGKNVLIVEDIVDSGRTMTKIFEDFRENKKAKSIKLATLLNKKGARPEGHIEPDFNALNIKEGQFIMGYGLDNEEYYRNLPYIGILINDQASE